MNDVDKILMRKDMLRSLVDEFKSPPNETVYEQAVRYGRLAHKAHYVSIIRDVNLIEAIVTPFELLSKEEQIAWIEVGNQIERITLKENS